MKLSFQNGSIFLGGIQLIMFRANTFLALVNEYFEREDPEEVSRIFKESTRIDSYIIAKKIAPLNLSLLEKIKLFTELISSVGIGELKVKQVSNRYIVFTLDQIFLSSLYKKITKKSPPASFSYIVAGFLEHFIYYLLKRKTKCIVKSSLGKRLMFKISLGKKSEIQELNYNYRKPKTTKMNDFTRKIVLNKHFEIRKDSIRLWNTSAILLPIFFLIELFKNFGEKYGDFYKCLGYVQGKEAVKLQKNNFGIKNKSQLFRNVIEQFEFIGMGKIILTSNRNYREFTFDSGSISFYKKYYSEEEEVELLLNYIISDIKSVYKHIFNYQVTCKRNNREYHFKAVDEISVHECNNEKKIMEFY